MQQRWTKIKLLIVDRNLSWGVWEGSWCRMNVDGSNKSFMWRPLKQVCGQMETKREIVQISVTIERQRYVIALWLFSL